MATVFEDHTVRPEMLILDDCQDLIAEFFADPDAESCEWILVAPIKDENDELDIEILDWGTKFTELRTTVIENARNRLKEKRTQIGVVTRGMLAMVARAQNEGIQNEVPVDSET